MATSFVKPGTAVICRKRSSLAVSGARRFRPTMVNQPVVSLMGQTMKAKRSVIVDASMLSDVQIQQLATGLSGFGPVVTVGSLAGDWSESEVAFGISGWDGRHVHDGVDAIFALRGDFQALKMLTAKAGWTLDDSGLKHPELRSLILAGDFVGTGPDTVEILDLLMRSMASGYVSAIKGKREVLLQMLLEGRVVPGTPGPLELAAQRIVARGSAFKSAVHGFLKTLPTYIAVDSGKALYARGAMLPHLIEHNDVAAMKWNIHGGGFHDFRTGRYINEHWATDIDDGVAVFTGSESVDPSLTERGLRIVDCTGYGAVSCDTGSGKGGVVSLVSYPELTMTSASCTDMSYIDLEGTASAVSSLSFLAA